MKFKFMYEKNILTYQNITFEKAMKLKTAIFLIILAIIVSFKVTNVIYYSNYILTVPDYKSDSINQVRIDQLPPEALEEEIDLFRNYLKRTNERMVLSASQEGLTFEIESFVRSSGTTIMEPSILAARIYYRVADYYKYRQYNVPLYIILAFLFSFIAEIFFLFKKLNNKSRAYSELRYLKRLIILYGSIKPVKFMDILAKMKNKSKYHSDFFNSIYEANIKTNMKLKELYSQFIQDERNLEFKLFYEKLDQANNYDFDQAILNIKNEFKIDRKARERRIKKQIQKIEIHGGVATLILVSIMVALYLLKPWLDNSLL